MSIGIFPKFSQIFPDEQVENIDEILNGCPSEFVLRIASHINAQLFHINSFEVEEELFLAIVNQKGIHNRDSIYKMYKRFKDKFHGSTLAIFPLVNVLKLIEHELKNFRTKDEYSNAGKELQVLKALLYFNEEMDKEHVVKKTGNTFHLLWTSAFNQYEFRKQKNFETELYLSFSLFSYFKKEYPENFSKYLNLFNCDDEIQFLKDLVGLFINAWNKGKGKLQCLFPKDIEEKNLTIKPFTRDLKTHDSSCYGSGSFKGLREKPLLKLSDDSFLVFNWNFIIDKFRQGLLFDFYQMSGLKDVIKFKDYKSRLGKEFSEKELFIKTMNSFYDHDEKIINHWDEQRNDWNFDYYLRVKNVILLIEFKDILMPDSIKESTGKEIERYLYENFVEMPSGAPKGISQLLNQIKEIDNNPNHVENYDIYGLSKKNLIIFPIIVYTDNSFSLPTINYNLSIKFREKLNALNVDFFIVYNPTLIGFGAIIKHYDYLKRDSQNIVKLLISYSHNLKMRSELMKRNPNGFTFLQQGISFDDYIDDFVNASSDISETYAFKEASKKLFPEENVKKDENES